MVNYCTVWTLEKWEENVESLNVSTNQQRSIGAGKKAGRRTTCTTTSGFSNPKQQTHGHDLKLPETKLILCT